MEDFFEEGVEEFIKYERPQIGKKSRNEKKEEKIEKLRADLKDPIQRKLRNQIRRQAEKQKRQREIQGMNEQQAQKYLRMKSYNRQKIRQRVRQAIKIGMPILIDLSYEDQMNQKENSSLAKQIQLITEVIKKIQQPPGIHLCGVQGGIKNQLEKMSYFNWPIASYQEGVLDVAKIIHKKLVYLSPDAPQPLQCLQEQTGYVIGGLVDRTVIKNASLKRAQELGLKARHFPIKQFMKNRICLNLDHVVLMLCKFKEVNNWQQAFNFAAPKRWKRSIEQKQQNKNTKQVIHSEKGQQDLQERKQQIVKKEQ